MIKNSKSNWGNKLARVEDKFKKADKPLDDIIIDELRERISILEHVVFGSKRQ